MGLWEGPPELSRLALANGKLILSRSMSVTQWDREAMRHLMWQGGDRAAL